MNSYYTNRTEGEHTRPTDIERALRKDFSGDADVARRQRLAVAHIQTEVECECQIEDKQIAGEAVVPWLYSRAALEWLHLQLCGNLTPQDLTLVNGTLLQPGQIRTRAVALGVHEAPSAADVPVFF